MYNQSEFLDASGNLNHEAVRTHFKRLGKLDGLKKGDVVYVDEYGRWEAARLVRRIPGDCWLAKRTGGPMESATAVVTSGNFGGVHSHAE